MRRSVAASRVWGVFTPVMVASTMIGCTSHPVPHQGSGRLGEFVLSRTEHFPALVRMRADLSDPLVDDALVEIAVSSKGATALFSEEDSGLEILIFGADGKLAAQIDRRGEGPGEFRRLAFLGFVDTTLYVPAPGRPALLEFDSHGRFLAEHRLDGTSLAAMGVSPGVIDIVDFDVGGFSGVSVETVGTRHAQPLITVKDSFVAGASTPTVGRSLQRPGYVRSGRFALVGNGRTYRIGVYDQNGILLGEFGRDLPPNHRGQRGIAGIRDAIDLALSTPSPGNRQLRERLDTIARERVAHFGRGGLGVDSTGRLWVVGRVGDSTFADVFADTTFLGRHILPCFRSSGGFAINGRFIALRCQEGSEAGYRLQLYRIVD